MITSSLNKEFIRLSTTKNIIILINNRNIRRCLEESLIAQNTEEIKLKRETRKKTLLPYFYNFFMKTANF